MNKDKLFTVSTFIKLSIYINIYNLAILQHLKDRSHLHLYLRRHIVLPKFKMKINLRNILWLRSMNG